MLDLTALDRPGPGAADRGGPGGTPSRFARVAAGQIVDAHGTPLLLRGVGLGNWLLPEGYMWGFGDSTASPRQIEALLDDLLGDEVAAAFWEQFRRRFITEEDIRLIAQQGFDHVRLPLNWRVLMTSGGAWLEDGFACIDRLIAWCRAHGLTVLLDLHGAPGGQTGTNIDDSLGLPELFMDERNADLTVALWTEIARRYRDEPTVLGYDLLNEPLPDEWQHRYPDELVSLYRRITSAIRSVDPHHLIMYEGTHWATGWDIFTEVWDENSVLQFHKYWSPADRPSIQRYIDVGRELGLPIYMGEGGENSPAWLAAAFQLYEDCGIGWNFWPWKKIDTLSSPCSVVPPAGWEKVLAFGAGRGEAPGRAEARRIFDELLANMDVEVCVQRPAVVNALFRRAPVRLPAYAFTFRGIGVSYGTATAHPHRALRSDDAVTLRRRDGRPDLDFTYPAAGGAEATVVAHLSAGEWLAFDVEMRPGAWVVAVVTDAQGVDAPALGGVEGVSAPVVTVADLPVPLVPDRLTDASDGTQRWSGEARVVDGGRTALRVHAAVGPLTLVAVDVARGDA